MIPEISSLKGPKIDKNQNFSIIESFKLREKFDKSLGENNIFDLIQEGTFFISNRTKKLPKFKKKTCLQIQFFLKQEATK